LRCASLSAKQVTAISIKYTFQTLIRLSSFAPNPASLLTYLLVQSPSWEANRLAASQEIPRISRNPKVHYRTHKRPPPVSILGQPNPAHIPTSYLLEIHPNFIHPSTPRSPQWSLYLPPKTTNDKTVNKISVVKRGLGLPHRVALNMCRTDRLSCFRSFLFDSHGFVMCAPTQFF
jgi:hypothetical protein